ncbi:response regulator [Pedobacter foliorum]|uniref:response regulator n=1 Tax=Pedobacter foliorum TaxID=2739058 RepID=UPI0015674E7D|nr:response regulator [Pedobacter foliorum]NRF39796.1 response regulator [Pedobacter foliorum]
MVELCTLWFSITTLSAVRSYVGGEGLWSKAQKDAILNLREYGYTYNEKNYKAFNEFLKVPFGDKIARMEMGKPNPDLDVVRDGFLQGRNHPDDIDNMIGLTRRFSKVYYLNKAFVAWQKAEPVLDELMGIGRQLHTLINAPIKDKAKISFLLDEIERLNTQLTALEDDFSYTLGEGARWLEGVVLRLVLALSITIGTTSIVIAISINRSIKKGLDVIVEGAELVKKGMLETRVKVFANDEIGRVATVFNEMTDTLEHNVAETKLTEAKLVTERERAESSDKAKHIFLVNMSHEIRTPMNGIQGFANYIKDSLTDKEHLVAIEMIIKSADHLMRILNDILDFSGLKNGEVDFMKQPIKVRDVIKDACLYVESNAKLKKIELHYSIAERVPKVFIGDSIRLSQIFVSLVSNAIKFTEKGEVVISADTIEENKDVVVIEFRIKDTGIGIPQEKQQKIFELFEQAANSASRKFGGVGLGLSMVKRLVELQNGKIFLESTPGTGSEFYFRMPFVKLNEAQKGYENIAVHDALEESGKGIKVLIVEDNPINQLLVIKVLQKRGYETVISQNGKIAIEKYKDEDFDIILMDLQMPEMDGYEATKFIRRMNAGKADIPIVAMTAHTIQGELEKCMAIGMNDYVSKPFKPEDLNAKIQSLVKKNRSDNEAENYAEDIPKSTV